MRSCNAFDPASFSTRLLGDLNPYLPDRNAAVDELREEHARIIRKASRSFAYFLRHFVTLADGGGTKMEPWRWQLELARRLPKIQRLLVLKARQLGLSWIAAAYALWVALFQRGALVLLVSQTEDDAVELLAKVLTVYEALPEWLRPEQWKHNTRCLKFGDLKSAVVALPSTRRAGRGRTAKLVIADEHAFHQWAEANFASLSPTVDAGGQFLIISTADGMGNLFADLCAKASNALGWVQPKQQPDGTWTFCGAIRRVLRTIGDQWLPLFIPYDVRPGREGTWWERKRETYPRQKLFYQEYPRDADEAFVQTGRPRFDKSYLDQHQKLTREPLPPEEWPEELRSFSPQELRIFELPKPGHRYAGGADVAEGLEHGDYSDLSVLDADAEHSRPLEVLSLHGHWEPDQFAKLIDQVARVYRGLYGIERNNHGYTALVICKQLGTPGIYCERPVLNKQGEEIKPGKPGWDTNAVTKPLMIDGLEFALRTFAVRLSDALGVKECVFYQVLKDGTTGAPAGQWDDRVMSRAIAVQMVKYLPPQMPDAPRRSGPSTFTGMSSMDF